MRPRVRPQSVGASDVLVNVSAKRRLTDQRTSCGGGVGGSGGLERNHSAVGARPARPASNATTGCEMADAATEVALPHWGDRAQSAAGQWGQSAADDRTVVPEAFSGDACPPCPAIAFMLAAGASQWRACASSGAAERIAAMSRRLRQERSMAEYGGRAEGRKGGRIVPRHGGQPTHGAALPPFRPSALPLTPPSPDQSPPSLPAPGRPGTRPGGRARGPARVRPRRRCR